MENELITIGIPVYNNADTIIRAVNSCLSQTYKNIELLLVSDASPDNSIDIVRKKIKDKRLTIFERKENGGIPTAMNTLMEQAKGAYLAILDADDEMLPTRIEEQYNAIVDAKKRYPNRMVASFCGSIVYNMDTGDKSIMLPSTFGNSFMGATGHSMYRVEDMKKLGGFKKELLRAGDLGFALKFLKNNGHYEMVDSPQMIYYFTWNERKAESYRKDLPLIKELIRNTEKEKNLGNDTKMYLDRIIKTYGEKVVKFKLFKFIPLIHEKTTSSVKKYYLFGFIPIIKIRVKKDFSLVYLFGFLLLLEIKTTYKIK